MSSYSLWFQRESLDEWNVPLQKRKTQAADNWINSLILVDVNRYHTSGQFTTSLADTFKAKPWVNPQNPGLHPAGCAKKTSHQSSVRTTSAGSERAGCLRHSSQICERFTRPLGATPASLQGTLIWNICICYCVGLEGGTEWLKRGEVLRVFGSHF